jgi:preprotein translocase subunit SecE
MSWWNRMTTFLREVRAEMAKVSFPGREEVVATTVVVVVASIIFGVFLFLADWLILTAYQWVFEVTGA